MYHRMCHSHSNVRRVKEQLGLVLLNFLSFSESDTVSRNVLSIYVFRVRSVFNMSKYFKSFDNFTYGKQISCLFPVVMLYLFD